MLYYAGKIVISALLITLVSEIARRSSLMGALIASIPLVSLTAALWLFIETKDALKVASFTMGIFWFTLPSLTLFLVMSILLRYDVHFFISMAISLIITIGSYWLMLTFLNYYGIKI